MGRTDDSHAFKVLEPDKQTFSDHTASRAGIRLLSQCYMGGLFSQINFVITHIETLGHADFHVDWTEGMPHAQEDAINLFDCLFYQARPACESDSACGIRSWPHYRYTGPRADLLYLNDYDGWRWKLHDCWNRLKVRNELIQEVRKLSASWAEDACALHVRNFRIGAECPGGRAPTLEDYARVLGRFSGSVFLSTDNREAVKFFRSLLGERLITREIGRSPDMETEYHLNYPQSARDAQDCLIDALIMARCRHLIHSVSNIATAVLYMNPKMDHTYVRSGGVFKIPARERDGHLALVKQTLATVQPTETFFLKHPDWRDTVSVYENGVFVRYADSKQSGTLLRLPGGELELRWLDGETERYSPVPPEYLRNPGIQGVELCFHLQKVNRVAVELKGTPAEQMFQYAFGLGMAKAWGNAELRVAQTDGSLPFGLSRFGISLSRLIPVREFYIDWDGDYEEGIAGEMLADIVESGAGALWLEGRFQSADFFASVENEVRELFSLPRPPLPEAATKGVPVAVHINTDGGGHGAEREPLSPSYYQEALERMREIFPGAVFLVFSEEPDKCGKFIPTCSGVIHLPPMDFLDVMALMQSCEAFILSDSLQCWWPAWLSGSDRVIRPERLSGDDGRKSLYPTEWMRLPACGFSK